MLLTSYSISDIITDQSIANHHYAGTFEGTEDADIKWPHRHKFYAIVWFTDSTGINVIDFDEYIIKPNRIFFMSPGQIHNWSYSKKSTGYILVFDPHFIEDFEMVSKDLVYIDLTEEYISILLPLFKNLIVEYKLQDQLSKKITTSAITYLLLLLQRMTTQTNLPTKPRLVLDFVALINKTISENVSVNSYAEKLNSTVEQLNLCCKESYGMSPKALILDKKITEAKRLLYFTNLSVKEIAIQLGFEDSSYFSRIFKRKVGCTPSLFKST